MFNKRTNILISAAMLTLAAITITASAALAAQPRPNGPAQNYLILTRDGKFVASSKPPCLTNPAGAVVCANDLHFIWATPKYCKNGYQVPPVFVLWTSNGRLVWLNQPLTQAPCRANDFEFAWNAAGFVTTASWTYNGHVFKQIPVNFNPNQPINDAHIYWGHPGRLLRAYWTLKGQPFGRPITVPPGTNDAHWILG
jgi:hypothetical protein